MRYYYLDAVCKAIVLAMYTYADSTLSTLYQLLSLLLGI